MKLAKTLLTFLLIFLWNVQVVHAVEPLTAREWSSITEQRKIYYLFGMKEIYQDKGIVFTKPADEYLSLLDAAAKQRISQDEDMDRIFWSVVYDNEPAARDALESLKNTPETTSAKSAQETPEHS